MRSRIGDKIRPALAYRPLTPLFDTVVGWMGYGPAFQRRVVELLDAQPGQRVLDLGCGTGTLLRELAPVQFPTSVIGVEPDGEALHLTRAKLAGLPWAVGLIQSLGQALPIRDESLDRVACTLVFHHLPTPVKYATAREIYRVLRQGGRLLLADYDRPIGWFSAAVLRLAGTVDGWSGMQANFAGQVPGILREAGFNVTERGRRYRGVTFLLATKVGQ